MYRIKIVAIIAALAMLLPPSRAEARRNQTPVIIGAAILGAAIASSASRSHRNDRYRSSDRYYGYSQPRYYSRQSYYVPAPRYYSDGYGDYAPSDVYRFNSGVGRDRLGTYSYDTGNMTQYGNSGCLNY